MMSDKGHPVTWVEIDGEPVALDTEIVPLVTALHQIPGLRTLQSCQNIPYVTFVDIFGETVGLAEQMADVLGRAVLWYRAVGETLDITVDMQWSVGRIPRAGLYIVAPDRKRVRALELVTEAVTMWAAAIDAEPGGWPAWARLHLSRERRGVPVGS